MLKILVVMASVAALYFLGLGQSLKQTATVQEQGISLGRIPKPTEPRLLDSALDFLFGKKSKKAVIRRIPKISQSMRMPHAYWGTCTRCHLYKDKKVNNFKTPWGNALTKVSSIKKVGPPILPDSLRPHPQAGRCIKCHNIVISSQF